MAQHLACPDADRLRGLLAGALSDDEQAPLTQHVEGCAVCQQMLEQLAGNSWAERARGLAGRAPVESALQAVVDEALSQATLPESQGDTPAGDELAFLAPARQPGMLGCLGTYHIQQLIGKGGFGTVFKAHDETLDRVVAIKVLAPQLATNATARRRFTREAKAAAAVSHDHVVGIHAVEEHAGLPYLVMQFVSGRTLQERLDQSGPLELSEILRIGMQIAEGLAAAHKQGLVHRDVKPSNILLENGIERVKITDFGLARLIDDASMTQSGVIAGTPMYMSPEQAAGEPVDHRADLFSLGSVLYFMCTGRPPFRASATMAVLKRVIEENPHPIREINHDIPDWLCAIIAKLHAKKPAERFGSAREVADLLGQHLAHLQQPALVPLPAPVAPVAGAEKPPRRRSLLRWLLIAAPFAVLLFFFGPSWWYFLLNKSSFGFEAPIGLEKLILKRDGEIVDTFSAVWAQLTLPPGTYELEAVCQPGKRVSNLVVQRKHLIVWEGFDQQMPNRLTLHLRRGEHVRLTLELADAEPAVVEAARIEAQIAVVLQPKERVAAGWLHDMVFSPDRKHLAWALDDGTIRIFDTTTGKELSAFKGIRRAAVAFSPNGKQLAYTGDPDGKNLFHALMLAPWQDAAAKHKVLFKRRNSFSNATLIFDPQGKKLIVGEASLRGEAGYRGTLTIADAALEQQAPKTMEYDFGIWALALSAEDNTVAAAGNDGQVVLWNLAKDEQRAAFQIGAKRHALRAALTPDGQMLAVSWVIPNGDSGIDLWDLAKKEQRATLKGHKSLVGRLAFSPDGSLLASGEPVHGWYPQAGIYTTRLWDVATGQPLALLRGAEGFHFTLALVFAADGKTLLSAHGDATVRTWDVSPWLKSQ